MKELIDKLDLIKRKNSYSTKDNAKRMRRQPTYWEKIFAKDTFDKGLLSKIYKELLKFNSKKNNSSIKTGPKTLREISPKKMYLQQISICNDVPHPMSSGKCKLKQQ